MRSGVFYIVLTALTIVGVFSGYSSARSIDLRFGSVVEKAIIQHVNTLYEHETDTRVVVDVKWIPRRLKGLRSDQIRRIAFKGAGLPSGYSQFIVEWGESGQSRSDLVVQAYVKVQKKVPLAGKRFQRGDTLRSSHLSDKWIDVTRYKTMPVSNTDQLQGSVVAHLINRGDPIYQKDIYVERVVEAGERVRMIYRKDGFNITISCIARQEGAMGDTIRLYHKDSGRTYTAVIKGKSKALWVQTY